VVTNTWSWEVVLASVPVSLGITSIIFGKHIDKLGADKAKHVYTLPVVLGSTYARRLAVVMMGLQYLFTVVGYLNGYYGRSMVLVFIGVPVFLQTVKVYSRAPPLSCPKDYPKNVWPLWFVAHAFRHNSLFGGLFLVSLLLDTFLNHMSGK